MNKFCANFDDYNDFSLVKEKPWKTISIFNLEAPPCISELLKKINPTLNNIEKGNICTMKYIINENDETIYILGEKFVKANLNKCILIVDGEEQTLSSSFNIHSRLLENNILTIKLKIIDDINDLSYLFFNCTNLLSVDNLSIFNKYGLVDLSYMFAGCSSLKEIPDIFQLEVHNVVKIKNLFDSCSSLKEIPDISNWNTKNVTNMDYLFKNCCLLESLPDISKWDLSKVISMRGMFDNCTLLKSLPEISK